MKNVYSFITYFKEKSLEHEVYDNLGVVKSTLIKVNFGRNECHFIIPTSHILKTPSIEKIVKKSFESIALKKTESPEECGVCFNLYRNKYHERLNATVQSFAICSNCYQILCEKCNSLIITCPFCRYLFYDETVEIPKDEVYMTVGDAVVRFKRKKTVLKK